MSDEAKTTDLAPGDVVDFVFGPGPDAVIPKAKCERIGFGYVVQEVRETPHGPGVVLIGGGGVWLASAFARRSQRIAAAAVRLASGEVVSLPPPARHHDIIQHLIAQGRPELIAPDQQGFVTECGTWARRKPALRIAQRAGQLVREPTAPTHGLFSEDVW